MSGGIGLTLSNKTPEEYYQEALGVIGWSYDPNNGLSQASSVSQRVYGMLVAVRPGRVITGAVTNGTAGASLSLAKVAVYTVAASPQLIVASANASTAYNAGNGYVATAFSSTTTAPASGVVYAACLFVGASTMPTLNRGCSDGNLISSGWPSGRYEFWTQSSQADMPASATPAATGAFPYFIALY